MDDRATRFSKEPETILNVITMDHDEIREQEANPPEILAVVSIGGSSVMDTAKPISWKRRIDIYQPPTIVSEDATVATSIAVRVDGDKQ